MPAEQQHKTSKRGHEKKRQILQQALECFTRDGVEGTTIDMIREASGTSVGSLYHHFGNKDAIAAAVYIEGMRDFARVVKDHLTELSKQKKTGDSQVEAGIKALVYANIDWINSQPDWARYVFQHRSIVKDKDDLNLSDDQNHFFNLLKLWFEPHMKKGLLKDLPLELFNAYITGPVHFYARHWLAGRYIEPLSNYKEEFAEAAWDAVRNSNQA